MEEYQSMEGSLAAKSAGKCIKHEISMWIHNSSLTKKIKIELSSTK